MVSTAQIDRIISEIDELDEREKIIFFHRIMEEKYDDLNKKSNDEVTIESAFGLWKNRNITKESLRKKAWG
uniref:Uncharacterized protein n=1 Tax=uncultured bacterium contig00051 TaxID=1181535 RepID=A0A806KL61_9BACT|nr:hypothetical protein [uncultured bacterium contig00051]